MRGIEAEVIDGFKALPKRGAEIGGALLGHRGPGGEFCIESWQPIAIEHRTGPSYILSDSDLTVWADFVNSARSGDERFIGVYRSQTRPGMAVTSEDCEIVEKFLPREQGVLLIVKPLSVSESVATFYLCDGGAVVDAASESREFEFGGKAIPAGALADAADATPGKEQAPERKQRRKIERLIEYATQAGNSIEEPVAATAKPQTARSAQARMLLNRWGGILMPVTAVAVGTALGFYAHARGGSPHEDPAPVSLATETPAAGLNLRTERVSKRVRLMWNPSAPVLAAAAEGVLLVDDSGALAEQRLTPADLHSGSLIWSPKSGETQFEMRIITASGREYSESIRVLQPRP